MDYWKSSRTVHRDASPTRHAHSDGFVDVQTTTEYTTEYMVITLLNGLVTGSGHHQRRGRKVRVKTVKLSCQLMRNVDSGDQTPTDYATWRIVLLHDKQPRGATPSITDIFGGINVAGTDIYDATYTGFMTINPSNIDRFHILADYVKTGFIRYSTAGAGDTGSPLWVDVEIPLNISTTYNAGNAGTISDIVTGAIYCLALRNNNDSDNDVTRLNARVYFEN